VYRNFYYTKVWSDLTGNIVAKYGVLTTRTV